MEEKLIPMTLCAPGYTYGFFNQQDHTINIFGAKNSISIFDSDGSKHNDKFLPDSASYFITNNSCDSAYIAVKNKNFVNLYSYPSITIVDTLLQTPNTIRHLSVNDDNTLLAVSTDSPSLLIYDVKSKKTYYEFKGHNGGIISTSFDPQGEYFLSCSLDGTIKIWSLKSKMIVQSYSFLTKEGVNNDKIVLCGFSHSGMFLCLPNKDELLILERKIWKTVRSVPQSIFDPDSMSTNTFITIIQWSPNDCYIAFCTNNNSIFIYDVVENRVINNFKHDSTITSLSWCPYQDMILITDEQGQYILKSLSFSNKTSSYVPNNSLESLLSSSSTTKATTLSTPKKHLISKFSQNDMDEEENQEDEEDINTSFSLRKDRHYEDSEDSLENDKDDADIKEQNIEEEEEEDKDYQSLLGSNDFLSSSVNKQNGSIHYKAHAPFQPSSSDYDGSSRYLCCNQYGTTISRFNGTDYSIEISYKYDPIETNTDDMYDSESFTYSHLSNHSYSFFKASTEKIFSKKKIRYEINYQLAAMSSWGTILGSYPDSSQVSPTINYNSIHFIPNPSNYQLNEFDFKWKRDRLLSVGIGGPYICCVTEQNNMRVFHITGYELPSISLPGTPVCVYGDTKHIIVVYNNGFQGKASLGYMLFDSNSLTLIHSDNLPISPKSSLLWIGSDQENHIYTYDSRSVIRTLTKDSFLWIVYADLNDKRNKTNSTGYHWIISISKDTLVYLSTASISQPPRCSSDSVPEHINLKPPMISINDNVASKSMMYYMSMTDFIFNQNILQVNDFDASIIRFLITVVNSPNYSDSVIYGLASLLHSKELITKFATMLGKSNSQLAEMIYTIEPSIVPSKRSLNDSLSYYDNTQSSNYISETNHDQDTPINDTNSMQLSNTSTKNKSLHSSSLFSKMKEIHKETQTTYKQTKKNSMNSQLSESTDINPFQIKAPISPQKPNIKSEIENMTTFSPEKRRRFDN